MRHNFHREVGVVRIICEPDRRLDASAAQDGDLIYRQFKPVEYENQIRPLHVGKIHQILADIGDCNLGS
ncbi:hypothetical protein D3C73_1529540 [compost metagenome]